MVAADVVAVESMVSKADKGGGVGEGCTQGEVSASAS